MPWHAPHTAAPSTAAEAVIATCLTSVLLSCWSLTGRLCLHRVEVQNIMNPDKGKQWLDCLDGQALHILAGRFRG